MTSSITKRVPIKRIRLIRETHDMVTNNVFSTERHIQTPPIELPDLLKPNSRIKMEGLKFLSHLPYESMQVAFLDPQYRGVLDKMNYGNEGKSRKGQKAVGKYITSLMSGANEKKQKNIPIKNL